jgi:periplasmic protein TonB
LSGCWTAIEVFRQDRVRSAAGVVLLHALLAYALIAGFNVEVVSRTNDRLKLFSVAEPTPPPPPVAETAPALARSKAADGAASPENLRARATPVVAPPPEVATRVASPVIAAPDPGTGSDNDSGASNRPGLGTGAGGLGTGTGSGREGDGNGAGGAPARLIRGRIVNSDYPRSAWRAQNEGSVTVHLTVGTSGRVTECRVARSSGDAELDSTTCRLIRERFRYEPARNSRGEPVAEVVGWRQTWWLE